MSEWYFIHMHHININDYLLTERLRRKKTINTRR